MILMVSRFLGLCEWNKTYAIGLFFTCRDPEMLVGFDHRLLKYSYFSIETKPKGVQYRKGEY